MDKYVERIINEVPMKIVKSDMALTPSRNTIFQKGNRKRMCKKETEEFHTSVSIVMFVAHREKLDIN